MQKNQWNDRYGGKWPDPTSVCKGPCEGTGKVPVHHSDRSEPYHRLWLEAEKKSPSEDGWHFVKCPDCRGTGKRR